VGAEQSEVSLLVAGEERAPPTLTQFLRIPLRGASTPEWRQWTAIYFPPAVGRRRSTIDVILYLHGHRTSIPGSRRSIWAYLKHKCWPLREHLAATGKAAVLVAPTLGPKSEPGTLVQPGGLDRYLDQTLAGSIGYWDGGSVPALGRLILAGHSGAGSPMRLLADSSNRAASLIAEVWGFDCTYGIKHDADAKGWSMWARNHPRSRLFIYYLPGTRTQDQAVKLRDAARGLSNVAVPESGAKSREGIHAHYWVPIQHWRERISESPHLRP
jgi:hypothetical protein